MTDAHEPSAGPRVRTDKVQVFLVDPHGIAGSALIVPRLLQLRRADEPMRGTWQPVMGTIEPGETAPRAAARELREETGFDVHDAGHELYQLDGVHPFYMAPTARRPEAIYLCPCFFVFVPASWSPVLNGEHDDYRWVRLTEAAHVGARGCVWPGQRASVLELIDICKGPPEAIAPLRIDPFALD